MDGDANPSQGVNPREKRQAAERIVRTLQHEGHVAYFAGGCVRDRIMGVEPSDYDVATDAPPERVAGLFRRARLVGQAFGVVRVGVGAVWVEVATFRTEGVYSDHRRPDRVEFSDAQRDAQRRDFTMNGLFYDPVADRVIDEVGGRVDIERRVVRAIGEPRLRFEEDYLRMLRAVRFAARLGFEIEPSTAEAISERAPSLKDISRERIGMETRAMLEHPTRLAAVKWLQRLRLDGPTLCEPPCDREPATLAALPAEADYPTALCAWLIDRHLEPHRPAEPVACVEALSRLKSVATVRRWRDALTLSNEDRDAMRGLLAALPVALAWAGLDVANRKRLLARPDWRRVRELLAALRSVTSFDLGSLDRDAAVLLAEGVAPTPLVTGDDLIAAGLPPGPAFQAILKKVYDAQLTGSVQTAVEAVALAVSLAAKS